MAYDDGVLLGEISSKIAKQMMRNAKKRRNIEKFISQRKKLENQMITRVNLDILGCVK